MNRTNFVDSNITSVISTCKGIGASGPIRFLMLAFSAVLVSCAGTWPLARPECKEPTSAIDVVKNLRAIQIGRSLYSDTFFSSGSFAACFGARKWRDSGSDKDGSRDVELQEFTPEVLRAVSVVWKEGSSPFRASADFHLVQSRGLIDSRNISILGVRADARNSFENVTAAIGPGYSRDTFSEELNEMFYFREPWNSGPAPDLKIIKYQIIHSKTEDSSLILTFKSNLLEGISLHSSSH